MRTTLPCNALVDARSVLDDPDPLLLDESCCEDAVLVPLSTATVASWSPSCTVARSACAVEDPFDADELLDVIHGAMKALAIGPRSAATIAFWSLPLPDEDPPATLWPRMLSPSAPAALEPPAEFALVHETQLFCDGSESTDPFAAPDAAPD